MENNRMIISSIVGFASLAAFMTGHWMLGIGIGFIGSAVLSAGMRQQQLPGQDPYNQNSLPQSYSQNNYPQGNFPQQTQYNQTQTGYQQQKQQVAQQPVQKQEEAGNPFLKEKTWQEQKSDQRKSQQSAWEDQFNADNK